MKNLLSASEIAALKLPGLPTTKVAITAMAKREGWYSEERTGLGGIRRVYAVPERYLPADRKTEGAEGGEGTIEIPEAEGTSFAPPLVAKVAGHIAAGARVDPAKLELAMRALREWEGERGVEIAEERRPAVIAILYDYLQGAAGDAKDAMSVVFRALG